MAATRSQLIAKVYRYLEEAGDAPFSEGGVPLQTAFEVLLEVEDEMLRDLDLSDQNRRVAKFEKRLSTAEFYVPAGDFNAPSYAFLRTDDSSTDWHEVEIVNHASINRMARDSRLAITFFGTPNQAIVSWEPDAGHTLQVWYDRTGESSPRMTGTTDVGSLYESHLTLKAAAQLRELRGLPVGPVMAARLVKGERQWEKGVNSSRQQGSVPKTMAFDPRKSHRSVPRFRLP